MLVPTANAQWSLVALYQATRPVPLNTIPIEPFQHGAPRSFGRDCSYHFLHLCIVEY